MKVAYSSNNVIVNDIKRTCSKQAKPTIQENGNKNQDLTLFLLELSLKCWEISLYRCVFMQTQPRKRRLLDLHLPSLAEPQSSCNHASTSICTSNVSIRSVPTLLLHALTLKHACRWQICCTNFKFYACIPDYRWHWARHQWELIHVSKYACIQYSREVASPLYRKKEVVCLIPFL